jgi:hypothetical protein
MTAIVVSSAVPFGAMSNQMVSDFFDLDQKIIRLQAAVATAASGYGGTAGTEYETGNFGVTAGTSAGTNGASFAYAINTFATNWATFRAANIASINQLDNAS